MSFNKKTIRDIKLEGKTVLVRVDYNVPIKDGKIQDDYRIKKSLPTLEYLIKKNCRIILISHLGRPEGKVNKDSSLKPCAARLEKLLNRSVEFAEDCLGSVTKEQIAELKNGGILLLENVRFHAEEEDNDTDFSKALASYADVFVQDAFGVVHHPAVSVTEIPKYLPAVAGLLVEKEVDTITEVMERPKRPLMAIIGGAKISDKIDILNQFLGIADVIAIGGAMANTFLLASGIKVGKSKVEREELPLAKEILNKAHKKSQKQHFIFYLPQDGVVADSLERNAKTRIVDWDAHIVAQIENYPKLPPKNTQIVETDEHILDIGPFSGAFISGCIQLANTVVWNGSMGVTEVSSLNGPVGPFAHGTETVVDALVGEYGHKPFSLVGGGDTVGYIEARGITDLFDHVSTGGGASMELISGKKLPGVEALLNKE